MQVRLKSNVMEQHFTKYSELVEEIQKISDRLEKKHEKYIECRKGCDLCCMDYSIFPVEYYYILDKLRSVQKDIKTGSSNPEKCIFLVDHICNIYANRPIICRTHGLPLVFINDDDEWELSACELNFTQFDMNRFTTENTLEIDTFNSRLYQINKSFIQDYKEIKYSESDLIPVKNLVEHLNKI